MAAPIKKPHRFKSGSRAKLQMKALRYGSKSDDPAISYAGMRGAIRTVMADHQRADPEIFGEIGRIEDGVVRRLRGVLTQNSIRMIETGRLVRDVAKPRPGKTIVLQARHVRAARLAPLVLSGRAHVDLSYLNVKGGNAKKKKKHADATAAEEDEAVDEAH